MQLREPLISIQNILKIKEIVGKKVSINFTKLRLELNRDGITNFDNNFINSFRFIGFSKKTI